MIILQVANISFLFYLQTFRPKKKFEPGTLRYSLHKQAEASLKSGLNLATAVKLPPGEDLNDWIAVHVVDFFNRINLIYGTITEFCTIETCPRMSGGAKYVLNHDWIFYLSWVWIVLKVISTTTCEGLWMRRVKQERMTHASHATFDVYD